MEIIGADELRPLAGGSEDMLAMPKNSSRDGFGLNTGLSFIRVILVS